MQNREEPIVFNTTLRVTPSHTGSPLASASHASEPFWTSQKHSAQSRLGYFWRHEQFPPLTLCPHTELEGYCSVLTGKSLVVTAHETNNVWIGELQKIKLRATNPGVEAPYFKD